MARPIEITDKHIEFIKKATEAKMSTREIAKEIKFSHMTVNRIQLAYGFKKPTNPTISFNNF